MNTDHRWCGFSCAGLVICCRRALLGLFPLHPSPIDRRFNRLAAAFCARGSNVGGVVVLEVLPTRRLRQLAKASRDEIWRVQRQQRLEAWAELIAVRQKVPEQIRLRARRTQLLLCETIRQGAKRVSI